MGIGKQAAIEGGIGVRNEEAIGEEEGEDAAEKDSDGYGDCDP